MSTGFYHNIYNPILVGGGPPQPDYSPEAQVLDARLGSLDAKTYVRDTERSYQVRGMWYPKEVTANPWENGSGVFVNAYA